ncbi:MAG: hypothetical protein H6818_20230 [Phycisphaerales bacterium]|nr:hypothetical protein [Phycisphaerales bacterium]
MTTKEQIIRIARQRRATPAETRYVLHVARETDDRYLLGVCLDCFRSVLEDSREDEALEVVRFLGELLRNPAYRRIRRGILLTAIWIGRASILILPELIAAYRKPSSLCVLAPARSAVIDVAWSALAEGDAAERAVAIKTFEQVGSLGLWNLRNFLQSAHCDAGVRSEVASAIERLQERHSVAD